MKVPKLFLLLLCGLLFQNELWAQEAPLKIHPLVGNELGQSEINRYKLHRVLDLFWNKLTLIEFYEKGKDSVEVVLKSKFSGAIQHQHTEPNAYLQTIIQQIRKRDKRLIEDLEILQKLLKNGDSIFVKVETHYGYEVGGQVIALEEDSLYLSEGLSISLEDLNEMGVSIGKFNPYRKYKGFSPNPDRYFLASNALGMDRGELVYKNTVFLINSLHYGISKNLSVGGGAEVLSMLNKLFEDQGSREPGDFQTYAFAEVKASKEVQEGIHVAVGGIYGGGFGRSPDVPAFGMAYLSNTFGSANLNVSTRIFLPLNYGRTNSVSSLFEGSTATETFKRSFVFPPLSLAFSKRISPSLYIVSENFYYSIDSKRTLEDDFGIITNQNTNNQHFILSLGVKIVKQQIAWDLGMVVWGKGSITRTEVSAYKSSTMLPLPYISMSYRFR